MSPAWLVFEDDIDPVPALAVFEGILEDDDCVELTLLGVVRDEVVTTIEVVMAIEVEWATAVAFAVVVAGTLDLIVGATIAAAATAGCGTGKIPETLFSKDMV